MQYVIDDAPAKEGFYTPGSHFLIRPSAILREDSAPDYLLIFAWSFLKEIAVRQQAYLENRGQMIVPLPEVRVVSSSVASVR
jgi:hypothetical protein